METIYFEYIFCSRTKNLCKYEANILGNQDFTVGFMFRRSKKNVIIMRQIS